MFLFPAKHSPYMYHKLMEAIPVIIFGAVLKIKANLQYMLNRENMETVFTGLQ
jgi:hypothetical protein